ncbi:hypothetical protein E6H23_02095 [Candidatus Bathyarchaeota archaeon]|nr:MAG: hypothetical protein E6H23_02095 [Candidatus Bathyarchaeota archaeon]
MNTRGALIAYAVTVVSIGFYLSSPRFGGGYYSNYDRYLLLSNILYSVGIGGMVTGPYFGVAALLVKKDESVWALVNRLIHGHISVPFIGGLALAWGGAFSGFAASFFQGMVIVPYTVFVFLGTLIT